MPSAARQRLPADLCRQRYRKHSNCSPGPINQEIQASPGHGDVSQEDKQHKHQGTKNNFIKSPRKQTIALGLGSPKSSSRRGSNDLSSALSDNEGNTSGHRKVTFELSSSAKSHSCPSLSPHVSDAYAMDSSFAPHPSEVPFPPLEWLQFSPKQSVSPVFNSTDLKAILRCHISA